MQKVIVILTTLTFLILSPATLSAQYQGNRIQSFIEEKLGSGKKPNNLINEKSPYLLQHAFNPVNWYPWGEDALNKARKEDKPIFLSIGYSTCHWCHVMADESFDNNEVAEILNKYFISIKVDREERPDIDQMYMAATQALSGSGGWPMSVFLIPDGRPFYAGTYFPPDSTGQRPGFKDLLKAIHNAWTTKREDINSTAVKLLNVLQSVNEPTGSTIEKGLLGKTFNQFSQNFDSDKGGFGREPKFPRPVVLTFLLDYYSTSGNANALNMVKKTLTKMAGGGIYDQIGGGFHRYSVDRNWFVPHFEKMLYDQAQLINIYLDGYLITYNPLFASIAEEIINYALRDLHAPQGGFFSAEDADSDNPYSPGKHSEGAFYLWSQADIINRLSSEDAQLFNEVYGIEEKGNVMRDPFNEFAGLNIAHQKRSIDETALLHNKSTVYISKSLTDSKNILFKARQLRKRPHLDDKIITGWNGMMLGALARGSVILDDPAMLEEATRTANFLREKLFDPANNTLKRRYRNGEAGIPGQLEDYVYLVEGLLQLYEASQDPKWLQWSIDLTKRQIKIFWNDNDGYFYDSVKDHTVKLRMRGTFDGAEPAGNSIAARNLIRLSQLHGESRWYDMAKTLIHSFSDSLNTAPTSMPLLMTTWNQMKKKQTQVIIAGEKGAEDTNELLKTVTGLYAPSRLLLLADGGVNQQYLAKKLPFLQSVIRLQEKATAYVCIDFTCKLPVTKSTDLLQQLKETGVH